jgi:hypothetical protein
MSNYRFPALLLLIALITHHVWLYPHAILSFADWSYWPTTSMHHLWSTWGTWLSFADFGAANIQVSFLFFKALWGVVALMGGTYATAVQITFLIPIILLSALAPYYCALRITRDRFAAFCGALFYASTTFFLIRQTAHLPIALVYALTPLILTLFDRALLGRTTRDWIAFLLVFSIGSFYEIRIMYLVSIILALFVLLVRRSLIQDTLRPLIFTGIGFVLLSAFWLLPVAVGGVAADVAQVANRGLFGSHLFSIQQALTLFESSWTDGYPNMDFEPQPIPARLWLIPLGAIVAFYLGRRTALRAPVLFFFFLALLGIFLTKQADIPGEQAYEWMYHHVPGFNLFREASKFYLFTALGYFGLLTTLLVHLRPLPVARRVVGGTLIALSLINLAPLATGEIRTLFVPRTIPSGYATLDALLATDTSEYKTLWIPTYARWSPHAVTHQKVSMVQLLEKYADGILYELNDTISDLRRDAQIEALLSSPLFPLILNTGSIKYVVLPHRDTENDDDFYQYYGGKEYDDIRSWYELVVDRTTLTKVSSPDNTVTVYHNTTYRPTIAAFTTLLNVPSYHSMSTYLEFATRIGAPVTDVAQLGTSTIPALSVRSVFETLTADNLHDGTITAPIHTTPQSRLYVPTWTTLTHSDTTCTISDMITDTPYTAHDIPQDTDMTIALALTQQDYSNLIPNPSFEEGLWHEKVGDCNNHDKEALLSMHATTATSTDGAHALALGATRHVACTSQEDIPIEPDTLYYLQFDYQTTNTTTAGFYLGFTPETSVSKRITTTDTAWHTYRRIVRTPSNAETASLFFYSYEEDKKNPREQVVLYDNVHLVRVPDAIQHVFVVEERAPFTAPHSVTFDTVHPTKKLVHIKGATTPFYLAMSESYHPQWQAQLNNNKITGFFRSWIPWVHPDVIPEDYHFKLDGFLNGWYVDTAALCATNRDQSVAGMGSTTESQTANSLTATKGYGLATTMEGCTRNEDGSYDIELVLEFVPQRWFYLGLLISGTTLVGCITYLIVNTVRRRRKTIS